MIGLIQFSAERAFNFSRRSSLQRQPGARTFTSPSRPRREHRGDAFGVGCRGGCFNSFGITRSMELCCEAVVGPELRASAARDRAEAKPTSQTVAFRR
jgi:hypothetical protein